MTPNPEPRADTAIHSPQPVLVWDAPVRVFHWLMVLCFAGAWITSEADDWRLLHVTLGYTLGGLVAFRLLWGVVGTRHARFASFVRGPGAVRGYLMSMLRGQPEHHTGHNPAGALAIVALLALGAVMAGSGWAKSSDLGGDWMEDLHEGAAVVMLLVVGVHLAGVVAGSLAHRENLVRAMFSGRKLGSPAEAIARAWRAVAVILLVAVLGFWWLQWQAAPSGLLPGVQAEDGDGERGGKGRRGRDRDRDDDD